jgi:hypothetical protein
VVGIYCALPVTKSQDYALVESSDSIGKKQGAILLASESNTVLYCNECLTNVEALLRLALGVTVSGTLC